jgi:hypothetical protein
VKGTLTGKGFAEIEFSLTPIKKAKEKSKR